MRRFGSDNMKTMMERLGMDDTQPIESKMISKAVESAQKRVEGNNYDSRKTVLSYDDVLREQREIIYKQRFEVINAEENLRNIVEGMIRATITRTIEAHTQNEDAGEWDYEKIIEFIDSSLLEVDAITVEDLTGEDSEELIEFIMKKVNERYNEKEEEMTSEQMREFEKVIMLRVVDQKWMDHIDQMDQLRQGIHLRAYGQNDPLKEYQFEGFQMFEQMVIDIEDEIANYIMKAEVQQNLEREQIAQDTQAVSGGEEVEKKKTPFVKTERVGRNDPCPCGSGKKYKNCHG